MSSEQQFNKILLKYKKKIKDQKIFKEVGEFAKDIVVERTQQDGKILNGEGLKKNPGLSESYKKKRKKMALSANTSPARSNLTKTGQMLDSLVVTATSDSVTIKMSNAEANQKATYAADGSKNRPKRPFLELSKKERALVVELLEELITKD